MHRNCEVNFSGSWIPDTVKQLHPHAGGLRWLSVQQLKSSTHSALGRSVRN